MRDMPVYVWVFVVNQANKQPSTVYARVGVWKALDVEWLLNS